MTPTLIGRWQTRMLLFAIVGSLVSLPFFFINDNDPVFFLVLLYIAGLGLVWDVVYNYVQQFRWDHDWPAALQFVTAIWEGIFFAILYKLVPLPGIAQATPLGLFTLHYSVAWLAIFLASQSVMRLLFPRWRFHGGQWL